MTSFNPLNHPVCLMQPRLIAPSGWLAHIPFGMFLVDILRPQLIVELGTQSGVSYCAFCQAVDTLNLSTQCFAVDTWEGDAHAGLYGSTVLTDLKRHHDPLYSEFSHLIQGTFDSALDCFEEGKIDILHIDGFHSYEAVKHDFESWLPKMSRRGVMLLHDIAVKDLDFGVWRLWSEVKVSYPHVEFDHGFGLGLLVIGEEANHALSSLLDHTAGEMEMVLELFRRFGTILELDAQLSHARVLSGRNAEQIAALDQQLRILYSLHQEPLVRVALAITQGNLHKALIRRVTGRFNRGLDRDA